MSSKYKGKKIGRKKDLYCWYCLENKANSLDHIISKSELGFGVGLKDNKIPCCNRCNALKSNRTLESFIQLIVEYKKPYTSSVKGRIKNKLRWINLETILEQTKDLVIYRDKYLLKQELQFSYNIDCFLI